MQEMKICIKIKTFTELDDIQIQASGKKVQYSLIQNGCCMLLVSQLRFQFGFNQTFLQWKKACPHLVRKLSRDQTLLRCFILLIHLC